MYVSPKANGIYYTIPLESRFESCNPLGPEILTCYDSQMIFLANSFRAHSLRDGPSTRTRIVSIIFGTLLVGAVAYFLWSRTATISSSKALARGKELVDAGKHKEAVQLLNIAREDQRLSAWSDLLTAESYEKEGSTVDALKVYKRIGADQAAGLYAKVATFRIEAPEAEISEAGALRERLNHLERVLSKYSNKDLLAQLEFLRGTFEMKLENWKAAAGAFKKVRSDFARSSYAVKAREAYDQLRRSHGEDFETISGAEHLDSAKLYLSEGSFDNALADAQAARRSEQKGSALYFESMLLEEEILRKMKRNDEADHTLMLVSADAGLGFADKAILKVAKNSWNINDHHRALEFVDNLYRRFPNSNLIDDARYIEGRILEEMNQLTEARNIYEKVIASSNSGLHRVRAHRRIAWLYLLGDDCERAAAPLRAAYELSAKELTGQLPEISNLGSQSNPTQTASPLSSQSRRDLVEEKFHAGYWLGYCLTRNASESAAHPTDVSQPDTAKAVWQTIAREDPFGYYGMLSRHELKIAEIGGQTDPQCFDPAPEELAGKLGALAESNILQYSEAEIDYFYPAISRTEVETHIAGADLRIPAQHQKAGAMFRHLLSRIKLSYDFGGTKRVLTQAPDLLRLANDSTFYTANKGCLDSVYILAHPTPYRSEFSAAAAESGVKLPLLYAIARTESHFDPQAVSRAGALGLLQLMPATASAEGLPTGGNLMLPSTNVKLGAKHLARTLKTNNGEYALAIAAYNAGQSSVNRWKARYTTLPSTSAWIEMIGYPETNKYVKSVLLADEMYRQRLERFTLRVANK